MIIVPPLRIFLSFLQKLLVVLSFCTTMVMGAPQYYGYALPSGFATFGYAPSPKLHQQNINLLSKALPSHYNNYYNRQPLTANQYFGSLGQPLVRPVYTGSPIKCAGCYSAPSSASLILPPKPLEVPAAKTAVTSNKLEEEAAEGFKILDELVETVAQAAGTAADVDPEEVAAVKSIFPDVIDEVNRQIKLRFEAGDLGAAEKDQFVNSSELVEKAIAAASSQTALSAILTPYVASIKKLSTQGPQVTNRLLK